MRNPMEECPPDEPINEFSITAKQTEDGCWYVACPEMDYRMETNESIDRHVLYLVREIMKHNFYSEEANANT